MTDNLSKIENHLNTKETNHIDIMDALTEEYVLRKLKYDKIIEDYGSLDGLFKALLKRGISKFHVHRRKKHGATTALVGAVLPLVVGEAKNKEAAAHGLGHSENSNNYNMSEKSHFGQTEYLKDKLVDLKEKVVDLKQDIQDLKTELRTEKGKRNEDQDLIRELKVDLATKEREMDLALKEQRLESKSFMDSEGFSKILDKADSTIVGLAGMSKSKPNEALNGSSVSSRKSALMQFIQLDQVDDDICNMLYAVSVGILEKPAEFIPKVQDLLNEFQIKTE